MSIEEDGGLTRREVVKRGSILAVSAGALGAFEAGPAMASLAATPKPKRGGTLRVGLPGGPASTDNLDPHLEGVAGFGQAYRQNVYSKLMDMLPNGSFTPQLAQSMSANKDATLWTIKLKKGITFHDGSELTVDDVIYTFKRILDPANKLNAARGNIDMIDPTGMRKVSKYVMTVKLTRPWSDFPAAVGQRYISIIKRGATTPFTAANANGTGAFKLANWKPGESYLLTANKNYFETGKPYLNAVSFIGISDSVARVNALASGQIDVMSDVPASQVQIVKNSGRRVIVNPGGGWTPLVMNTNAAPYNDPRVRQAMKLLIDRKQAIAVARQGYGTIGNDLFAKYDPLYASNIPQRQYDPEKAKSLLKAAGHLDTEFVLRTAEAESDFVPARARLLAEREEGRNQGHRPEGSGGHVLGQHLGCRAVHLQLVGLPLVLHAVAAVVRLLQRAGDTLERLVPEEGVAAGLQGGGDGGSDQAQEPRGRGAAVALG